jgi:AcrR family transcriptional regulator
MGERIDGRSLRYVHRRGELLEAVGEYVLDNGVATLTLRGVADAVGVSHATLQHHFGTREELVGIIVEHLLERTFAPGEDYPDGFTPTDVEARLRGLWAGLKSPTGLRDTKLFTEALVRSLFEDAAYAHAVAHSIESRLDRIAGVVVSLGCPEDEAKLFATILLALLRGLSLDLLATGDEQRVDATFEVVLEGIMLRSALWASERSAPEADASLQAAHRFRRYAAS